MEAASSHRGGRRGVESRRRVAARDWVLGHGDGSVLPLDGAGDGVSEDLTALEGARPGGGVWDLHDGCECVCVNVYM